MPRSCAESAITPERAYLPLDQGIVEDVASKHPHDEIEARLARLAARAALPSATALDRAVADDWRHILGAKENAS